MALAQGLPTATLWHSLASEIHDFIWKHVFTLDYQISAPHRAFREDQKTSAQLLHLNKAMYSRYYPTFWSCNLFRLEVQFRSNVATLWQPSAPFSAFTECIQTISMSCYGLKQVSGRLPSFSGLKRVYVDEFYLDSSGPDAEEILGTDTIKRGDTRDHVSSGFMTRILKRNPGVEFALVVAKTDESHTASAWCYIAGLDDGGELEFRKVSDFDTRALSY